MQNDFCIDNDVCLAANDVGCANDVHCVNDVAPLIDYHSKHRIIAEQSDAASYLLLAVNTSFLR